MSPCAIRNCPSQAIAKALCQFHYDHARRYPNAPRDYIRPMQVPCSNCAELIPVSKTGSLPDLCSQCALERHRAKSRERRHRTAMREYGLTPAIFASLSEAQRGCCAICGSPPVTGRGAKNGRLSVDHDHSTGAVRGLLCHQCNAGLGNFRDDPRLLSLALAYLGSRIEAAS